MGVNYAVLPMPQEKLKMFREAAPRGDIALPQPNPFMPKNLDVVGTTFLPRDQYLSLPAPRSIVDNDSMLAYYAPDLSSIRRPKFSGALRLRRLKSTMGMRAL